MKHDSAAQLVGIAAAIKAIDMREKWPNACWRWNLPHETERPFCNLAEEHLGPCHVPDTVDETQAVTESMRVVLGYLKEESKLRKAERDGKE